jgi:hypothetical protein
MIVYQTSPFRHTYLIDVHDEVCDILLTYNHIVYPYDIINFRSFRTPSDFDLNVFMIQNDLRDWEVELLILLDIIDHPL